MRAAFALLTLAIASVYAAESAPDARNAGVAVTTDSASTGTAAVKTEEYKFEAEVGRLMDIIINSLYSKKEIFLRELISNAADATDKIRFLALADDSLLGTGEQRDLEIRISGDKASKTMTIRDRGVGMTKAELIANLGTVAKSGTAAFMEQMSAGADVSLIGQFGVGFYSVYLVADRVRVASKANGDSQWVWESTADGTFTVAEDPRGNTLGRGTEITLYLKDDATDYAEPETLRKLVKKYSEFITFPILLSVTKSETVEVPVSSDSDDDAAASPSPSATGDEDAVQAEDESEDTTPKTKSETRDVTTWEVVNDQKAIWTRKNKDITTEEYIGFYRTVTKAVDEPITWSHFTAEGEVEFRSILYVPPTAPGDLYDNYYSKQSSLRLYVRKVLISDEFEELLPRYLSFIKGVVDSDDLPLNVSRETLQQHKILKVMGKKLVRKALEMIKKLADDQTRAKAASDGDKASKDEAGEELSPGAATAYDKFWAAFGKAIKLGIIEDSTNRSKLAKLLRFRSTKTGADGWRSLDEYVADMAEGQKQIYFIAGESYESVNESPFLERLRAADLEVLYLTDPIDEHAIQNLPEFENFRLQSITKEGLSLPGDGAAAKRREEAYKTSYAPLVTYLKSVYGNKVEKVTISNRLSTSPCILVTSQYGYSANMERIMRSQAFSDPERAKFLLARKTMEINPRHPIISELKARAEADPEVKNEDTQDIARLLFDTALLNSGFSIDDNKDFATRMYRLMKSGLKLDSLELLPEEELPAEEEEEEDEEEDVEEEEEESGEDGEL